MLKTVILNHFVVCHFLRHLCVSLPICMCACWGEGSTVFVFKKEKKNHLRTTVTLFLLFARNLFLQNLQAVSVSVKYKAYI